MANHALRGEGWREVREGWPVLLAGILAISISMPTLSVYSLTYFMAPWKAEFGWAREDVAIAVTWLTVATFLVGAQVGKLCDRHGVRRVASISVVLFSLGAAGLSQIDGSLWQLYLGYAVLAIVGAGAGHICYLRSVAARFDQARGFALGIVGAGTGVWAAVAPSILNPWIAAYGWRAGWMLLATIALCALPLIFIGLRERPVTAGGSASAVSGMTMRDVRRTFRFWLMFAGIFLMSVAIAGPSIQMLPVVTEVTGSAEAAVAAASAFGIALIVSRISTGLIIDHLPAHIVAAIIFTGPALAVLALSSGHAGAPVLFGIFLGLASGAEVDIVSFLVARYFGLKSFSEIFGWMFASLSLGGGFGSLWIRFLKSLGVGLEGLLATTVVASLIAASAFAALKRAGERDAHDAGRRHE